MYNVYIAIDNQFDAYGFGRADLPSMYMHMYNFLFPKTSSTLIYQKIVVVRLRDNIVN